MSVCLFVSNKRQNGWTDQTQILFGTSRDPREGLWIIKTSKICVSTLFIFCKIMKMRKKYHEIRKLFYTIHKANIVNSLTLFICFAFMSTIIEVLFSRTEVGQPRQKYIF